MTFKKFDKGKLRWASFPWAAASQVMEIIEFGAQKYGMDNWRLATSDEDKRRYWSAAMRHMLAHLAGEALDKESGKKHLAHAATCLLYILSIEEGGEK